MQICKEILSILNLQVARDREIMHDFDRERMMYNKFCAESSAFLIARLTRRVRIAQKRRRLKYVKSPPVFTRSPGKRTRERLARESSSREYNGEATNHRALKRH